MKESRTDTSDNVANRSYLWTANIDSALRARADDRQGSDVGGLGRIPAQTIARNTSTTIVLGYKCPYLSYTSIPGLWLLALQI